MLVNPLIHSWFFSWFLGNRSSPDELCARSTAPGAARGGGGGAGRGSSEPVGGSPGRGRASWLRRNARARSLGQPLGDAGSRPPPSSPRDPNVQQNSGARDGRQRARPRERAGRQAGKGRREREGEAPSWKRRERGKGRLEELWKGWLGGRGSLPSSPAAECRRRAGSSGTAAPCSWLRSCYGSRLVAAHLVSSGLDLLFV